MEDKQHTYLNGFGNFHRSETEIGILPDKQNSPQMIYKGLYAEQISGSAFTRPRHQNLYAWLYRKQPSTVRPPFEFYQSLAQDNVDYDIAPNPMRWNPLALEKGGFLDTLFFIASNEHARIYAYDVNLTQHNDYFVNYEAEQLFICQSGKIEFITEYGKLTLEEHHILVIPKGITFKLSLISDNAKGFLCENYHHPFHLPELGPIGANGLAYARHFEYPVAFCELKRKPSNLYCKANQKIWKTTLTHSPLNVLGWQGNYAPYRYDLRKFNTINTVSFDHPDPSIYTVLTTQSDTSGVACIDFVIFPQRWLVAEDTFRPPYFHRNVMSEFLALIQGEYDAKSASFKPGGFSIHNSFIPHGPDYDSYQKAITEDTKKPIKLKQTMAFMLESISEWKPSKKALDSSSYDKNYHQCWSQL